MRKEYGELMTFLNPARAVWHYLRGEDIKAADRRAIEANAALATAGRAAATSPVGSVPGAKQAPSGTR